MVAHAARRTSPQYRPRGRRHRVGARPARERPAVVDFQTYARFERWDHAQNCARFYTLTWQPLLWGDVALIRSWGRIGQSGSQRLEHIFSDRESTQPLAEKLIRRRIQRRYELVECT